MFSDGDEVLRSIFRILLLITHFQVVSVYSFITLISHCTDRKSLRILTPCQYDSDCVENAYCYNYKSCFCRVNFVLERNQTHFRCLRVARGLGDPCEENVQCQLTFGSDAECRENSCLCSLGSRFVEERCYKTVGLGEYCQTNRNCHVEGSKSFCMSGRCVCPLLHHPSRDGTRCVKTVSLRENCTSSEECITENSQCIGECGCDVNHVISSNNSVCLKIATAIGESCEEDSQCIREDPNLKCQGGKCSCKKGHHRRSTICHRSVGLNESCENHEQCTTLTNMDSDTSTVTNVDCFNGVCSCSAHHTFTPNGLDCIGFAENGVLSWRLSPILIIAAFIVVN